MQNHRVHHAKLAKVLLAKKFSGLAKWSKPLNLMDSYLYVSISHSNFSPISTVVTKLEPSFVVLFARFLNDFCILVLSCKVKFFPSFVIFHFTLCLFQLGINLFLFSFSKVLIYGSFCQLIGFLFLVWVSPFRFSHAWCGYVTSWGHERFSRIEKCRHYGETHSCVCYFDLLSYYHNWKFGGCLQQQQHTLWCLWTLTLPHGGRTAFSLGPFSQVTHIKAIWKRKYKSREDIANNKHYIAFNNDKGMITTT